MTHKYASAGDHLRAEEWSIHLHSLVAEKLRKDPEKVIWKARRNLARMRQLHGEAVQPYVSRWEELLNVPVEDLIATMLSPSQEARDLRQCTPFAGVLAPRERWAAFRAFSGEWRRKHAAGPA